MQLCIKPTERYKQKSYVFASYYQMSTNVYHVKTCHDSIFLTLDFKSLESSLELVHKLTEPDPITESGPENGIEHVRDTDSNKSSDFLLNPVCIMLICIITVLLCKYLCIVQ